MTIEDLKPYISKLEDSKVLCIYSNANDSLLDMIYIHLKNKKPYEYVNVFFSKEIEENSNEHYFFSELRKEDCHFVIQPTKRFFLYKRRENYNEYMKALEDKEMTNAKLILNEIKKDQGKYVTFNFGGNRDSRFEGFLLTVVAGDEDYYYVFLKQDNTLGLVSCVSGYNVVEEEQHECPLTDKEIFKMLHAKFEEEENSDALIYLGNYKL
jgi:hypothetical protein